MSRPDLERELSVAIAERDAARKALDAARAAATANQIELAALRGRLAILERKNLPS